MKRFAFILALVFVLTGTGYGQTTVVDSIQSDGVWRRFRVYVPTGFGTGRALILNMHGLGSNATDQQAYSNFKPIADTAGFLMVYPQGLSFSGTTYWNAGVPGTPPTDDVKFLSALIDTMQRRYGTDRQRVFATGMSLGGYMSYYLACKLPQKIAAIASVTGTMFSAEAASCTPGRPVPVMQVHGTADATVPYTGSNSGIAIDSLVAMWVRLNGCNPTPVQTPIANSNTTDNSTADHFVYGGGTRGATVEFYKVYGGGHTWPGAVNIGLTTNQDFSASKEIWRFFSQYRLGQLLSVSGIPAAGREVAIGPNPFRDELHIDAQDGGLNTLRDIIGRTVIKTTSTRLDVRGLPAGLYLLERQVQGERKVFRVVKE